MITTEHNRTMKIALCMTLAVSAFVSSAATHACFCGKACLHGLQGIDLPGGPFHGRCPGAECKSCNLEVGKALKARSAQIQNFLPDSAPGGLSVLPPKTPTIHPQHVNVPHFSNGRELFPSVISALPLRSLLIFYHSIQCLIEIYAVAKKLSTPFSVTIEWRAALDSKKFRVGEFEIFAYDSGELRWQSHCGLGECRKGRCFKRGDILFFGPAENYGPGFLKLEFLDRLERLPAWTLTRYYTTCLDIYRCRTGKAVSAEEFVYRKAPLGDGESAENRLRFQTPVPVPEAPTERSPEEVNCRLENYEIAKRESGDLVWYSYAGPGMLEKWNLHCFGRYTVSMPSRGGSRRTTANRNFAQICGICPRGIKRPISAQNFLCANAGAQATCGPKGRARLAMTGNRS